MSGSMITGQKLLCLHCKKVRAMILSMNYQKHLILFVIMSTFLLGMNLLAGEKPKIDTPKPGDILQGVVTISGTTDVFGYKYYEVLFGYNSDPTDSWFLIDQKSEKVTNGSLAVWDTSLISDGTYRVLVRVYLDDGNKVETMVPNLRVRNYTAIETPVPTPTTLVQTVTFVKEASETEESQRDTDITVLATNPAAVNSGNVVTSLVRGVVIAIILLVFVGGFLSIRAAIRKK